MCLVQLIMTEFFFVELRDVNTYTCNVMQDLAMTIYYVKVSLVLHTLFIWQYLANRYIVFHT